MRKFLLVALLSLFPCMANADFSVAECGLIAASLNTKYPKRLDEVATILKSDCMLGKGRTTLVYKVRLEGVAQNVIPALMTLMEKSERKALCSGEQRSLLEEVNVQYRYSNPAGGHIGETTHKIEYCQR